MFGRSKPILGLDIGSHSIKAVLLGKGKSGLVLQSVGLVNLPPEAIIEGSVQEPEVVVSAIKNVLKSLKVKVKNTCTSISGYSVIIKKISLPTSTEEELAENIEVEAEQFIPFDISDVNIAFQILGQKIEDDQQMEVILVAAKKDVIESYIGILTDSGLKPTIIDVDAFALENVFQHSYPEESGIAALIDIGANKMNINIVKEGISLMTKDAAIGGARITSELQDRFDLDYNQAEAVKIGGVESEEPAVVTEIVSRAIEGWAAEAKRTFDSFEGNFPGEKPGVVYLSGGSSRVEGLSGYFEQELGVAVHHLDPFVEIGVNQKQFDPEYIQYLAPQTAVCLGLALRRGEEI